MDVSVSVVVAGREAQWVQGLELGISTLDIDRKRIYVNRRLERNMKAPVEAVKHARQIKPRRIGRYIVAMACGLSAQNEPV